MAIPRDTQILEAILVLLQEIKEIQEDILAAQSGT